MNEKFVNRILLLGGMIILFLGFIFKNCGLYIYGTGVLKENELTFGLIDFIGLKKISYYEINFFYSCLLVVLLAISVRILTKTQVYKDVMFKAIQTILLLTLFIPVVVLSLNYEEKVNISLEEKNYAERFMPQVDDLIQINQRIKIKLDEFYYVSIFYSLSVFPILFIILLIKKMFLNQDHELKDIDHIIEFNQEKG